MRLKNKVAVVTGAARGIGYACASLFAREGAMVVVGDRLTEEGARAAESIVATSGNATFAQCDVTDPNQVRALVDFAVETYGRLDICVANAGVARAGNFLDITPDEWADVLGVNLTGCFYTGQAAARRMVQQGDGGTIVNVASVESVVAHAPLVAYVSSKGGVAQLTRAMAVALAEKGIRVNAVGPGSVKTEMLRVVAKDNELTRMQLSRTPMGRYAEPEEIAHVILFLASDESSYVTGQIVYADGGRLALHYTVPVGNLP